jgi:16S rRNA processing protein RimM
MKEFAVAKVGKSFGTHGELTINLYDTFPSDFTIEEPLFVFIDKLAVPLFFDSFERRGQRGAVGAFADLDTPYRAAELIGKELFMGLEEELLGLEPEGEDEYDDDGELYLEDMVGYKTTFEGVEGIEGEIVDFEDSEWNPLFIINLGGKEVMIPAADDFIVEFSIENKTVHFALPDGLLDLN